MNKSGTPEFSPPPITSYPPPPTVAYPPALGPHCQVVQCPSCHATITTRVKSEPSTKTHAIAAILCCVSCCCCLPYLIDSCQDQNHYCPNCNAFIGKH